jgi:hypothetical protein
MIKTGKPEFKKHFVNGIAYRQLLAKIKFVSKDKIL